MLFVSRVAQSVQCLATGWTTGRSRFDPQQRRNDFFSRPALGSTQPPVKRVPEVLSPGLKCGRGVTLTTHPHLLPRSRMSRSYTSSLPKRLRGVKWAALSTMWFRTKTGTVHATALGGRLQFDTGYPQCIFHNYIFHKPGKI
jgi:hypothetical protein